MNRESKARMAFLRKHCADVTVIETENDTFIKNCRKRNEHLIEQADYMVAIYDNACSACGDIETTVRPEEKKELLLILIHPDSGIVTRFNDFEKGNITICDF